MQLGEILAHTQTLCSARYYRELVSMAAAAFYVHRPLFFMLI